MTPQVASLFAASEMLLGEHISTFLKSDEGEREKSILHTLTWINVC